MTHWQPWLWLAGGVLLCAAEALAPGVFLIWLGAAAVGTGVLLVFAAFSIEWQLLVFCGLALVSVAVGRRVYGPASANTDRPFLNRRAEALIGRLVVLHDAIQNGEGRARIDDTVWRVAGPDLPAGARVRIVAVVDSGLLRVEAA